MQPRQLKSMLNSSNTDQYWCRPFRVLSEKNTIGDNALLQKQNSKHTLKTGSWH